MRILALDTTTEFGSIALFESDRIVDELLLHSTDGFGHILYDHLGRILERNSWNLAHIDCFAAASGPGSFTGVRVGLAAIKGLAEAEGKPVVAVSNLEAIASFGTAPLRAAFLDARRGEIYGGVYDAALTPVSPERVAKFPDWLESLPDGEMELISTDLGPFRAALAGARFKPVEAGRTLAGAIARIAAQRIEAGLGQDPAAIDANYVRRSDAELYWKDK